VYFNLEIIRPIGFKPPPFRILMQKRTYARPAQKRKPHAPARIAAVTPQHAAGKAGIQPGKNRREEYERRAGSSS